MNVTAVLSQEKNNGSVIVNLSSEHSVFKKNSYQLIQPTSPHFLLNLFAYLNVRKGEMEQIDGKPAVSTLQVGSSPFFWVFSGFLGATGVRGTTMAVR